MIIRKPTAEDVPTLRAMLQKLSDHDGGSYAVASELALRQGGFGPRPLFHAILAEDGGKCLGMAIFYPDFSTHRGEPGAYVQDIWVEPAARGLGLGRRLLAQVMAVQDWGARYLVLAVSPENVTAAGFYERLGFERRGYEMLILSGAGLKQLS